MAGVIKPVNKHRPGMNAIVSFVNVLIHYFKYMPRCLFEHIRYLFTNSLVTVIVLIIN
jgi:hypothetical protein